jgi:hypothetical protein
MQQARDRELPSRAAAAGMLRTRFADRFPHAVGQSLAGGHPYTQRQTGRVLRVDPRDGALERTARPGQAGGPEKGVLHIVSALSVKRLGNCVHPAFGTGLSEKFAACPLGRLGLVLLQPPFGAFFHTLFMADLLSHAPGLMACLTMLEFRQSLLTNDFYESIESRTPHTGWI